MLVELQEGKIKNFELPFKQPFVIRGGGDDMFALKWDETYLREMFKQTKIDVEVYKKFEDYETSKSDLEPMHFGDFMDKMEKENVYIPDCSLLNLTTPRYVDGELRVDTLDRRLLDDLHSDKLLENPFALLTIPVDYYFFMGVDTKTGAHLHIEDDYLTCQIVGEKDIWLCDYEHLNIRSLFDTYNNFAKENVFKMDWDMVDFPIYHTRLKPGDMIVIPPNMWHWVKSDGFSIAVAKIFENNDFRWMNSWKYRKLRYRQSLNQLLPTRIKEFWRMNFG